MFGLKFGAYATASIIAMGMIQCDGEDPPPDSGTADAGPAPCEALPTCDLAPPTPGARTAWRHPIETGLVALGGQRHRGRDLLLRAGEPQWALAKFAYGAADDDLKDENVEVWLARDCAAWERLGTARTTRDGDHADVEGVEDTGGWVFFEIPASAALGPGRHRIHFVVSGDHTRADQIIDVIDRDVPMVLADVDGTLTEDEYAEAITVLSGPSPAAQPTSAEALWAFADRGYRIFYLTARPHWLSARTHEWLDERGYPPGLVHTTLRFEGALGSAAEDYKTDEILAINARIGHPVDYAIGNSDSDAAAYEAAGITQRYFYRFGDGLAGVRFDDYAELIGVASALPAVCP
jgi:hypothetical protein